ncbi:MAG: amidase [Rhodobacterales bacterium]|nr:MAG: amidase [Rhodobacterales bacterium]
MSDFLNWDALRLSKAIEDRQISAEEVMRATLARISEVNGTVNALVSLRDQEALLAEARVADHMPRRGWMHGLPLAVKDLANARGLSTSMGSPLLAGQVADHDDLFVKRMRDAGAIIIGKTNTPEFGLGSHTFNPVYGATRNPYDCSRSAGGSSGGAAAALACRMLAVADGSDMMGSLRNPAAWNNVYGFRPSFGRVPSEPVGDSFLHQLATNGPMARSPSDIAALLDTQSGPDPRQPHGCQVSPVLPHIKADIKGRRIGWLGNWGGAYEIEPDLLAAGTAALQSFRDLGCEVEEIAPPFSADQIWQAWTTLRSWAVVGGLARYIAGDETRAQIKSTAIWEIERGMALTATEVHKASVIRSQWFRKAAQLFDKYDALVLPTTQVWPFPIEWDYPETINDRPMDTYHRWMEIVIPIGLLGLPCLNLPAGFGAAGLPHGLQLFGPRGGDLGVLQIAEQWHAATSHLDQLPPLLS